MSGLVERLRSSAEAFRKHNVYTQDGDPIRLTVQASEADEAADVIEHLKRFANHHSSCPANHGVWAMTRKCTCGLTALLARIEGEE